MKFMIRNHFKSLQESYRIKLVQKDTISFEVYCSNLMLSLEYHKSCLLINKIDFALRTNNMIIII
jgi:hypothetical protein